MYTFGLEGKKERSASAGTRLKDSLPFQVRVCIMPSQALRMLTNVATFWAGFWGWEQVGRGPFLATNWSLQKQGGGESKERQR